MMWQWNTTDVEADPLQNEINNKRIQNMAAMEGFLVDIQEVVTQEVTDLIEVADIITLRKSNKMYAMFSAFVPL